MNTTKEINIYLSGLPYVGKSTLTNALTGTNLSKSHTDKEHVFIIDPNHNTSPVTKDTGNKIVYTTKQNKQNFFPENLKITIHDTVGNTKKLDSVKKHQTIKNFNCDALYDCDILLTVIDVNVSTEDMKKNLEQIKFTADKIPHKLHSFLHICIVNKCDDLIYSDDHNGSFVMGPENNTKFKKIKSILEQNGCNVIIPIKANDLMLFSSGTNGFFPDYNEGEGIDNVNYFKSKYKIDSDEGKLIDKLLERYGLKQIANLINNFINDNYNYLINKRILADLINSSNNLNLNYLIESLKKLVPVEDENIIKIIEFTKENINNLIPKELKSEEEIKELQKSFGELEKVFKEKTQVSLNSLDSVSAIITNFKKKMYIDKLNIEWSENAIKELYEMQELDMILFCSFCQTHMNENNIQNIVSNVMHSTKNDPDYLYYLLHFFLAYYPKYILPLKAMTTKVNTDFELIKMRLIQAYDSYYDENLERMNYVVYRQISEVFHKIISNITKEYECKEQNICNSTDTMTNSTSDTITISVDEFTSKSDELVN